jgi:hypothetical protein
LEKQLFEGAPIEDIQKTIERIRSVMKENQWFKNYVKNCTYISKKEFFACPAL